MEKQRRISSVLLLAVLLPAFIASVFHTHHSVTPIPEECAECVHHLPHAGHISTYNGGISDCILCHFLGLPCVVSSTAAILLPTALRKTFYFFSSRPHLAAYLQNLNTRAPPVFSVI